MDGWIDGFYMWLRRIYVRNSQLSQITKLRSAGTFLPIVLQDHQCLDNHISNNLFGYRCNKTGSYGKIKRLLFIWEEAAVGKGSCEDSRKEGQRIRRCTDTESYLGDT